MKKPGLWGMLAIGGQNGGVLLYFIKRRKYLLRMSMEQKRVIESRKKKIFVYDGEYSVTNSSGNSICCLKNKKFIV